MLCQFFDAGSNCGGLGPGRRGRAWPRRGGPRCGQPNGLPARPNGLRAHPKLVIVFICIKPPWIPAAQRIEPDQEGACHAASPRDRACRLDHYSGPAHRSLLAGLGVHRRGWQPGDHGRRRRERVRQRDRPDRRQVRAGDRDREQPQHRPAHVRGEPERGPGGQRRPARGAERHRLRHLHEQDRVRVAEPDPQGHRRAAPARPAGQHAEPAPVVLAGARCRPWPRRSPPTCPRCSPAHAAYFTANLRRFDASLQPWYQAIAQFKAAYPGTPVAITEPVGDYMLQAAGTKNLTPFTLPGRHHERRRPVAAGRVARRTACSPATR